MPTRRAHSPGRPAHKDECKDPQENGPAQLRDVSRTPRSRTNTRYLRCLVSIVSRVYLFFFTVLYRFSFTAQRSKRMVWAYLADMCEKRERERAAREPARVTKHTHTHTKNGHAQWLHAAHISYYIYRPFFNKRHPCDAREASLGAGALVRLRCC